VGAALAAVPLFVPWPRLLASWRVWGVAVVAPIGIVTVWVCYYNALRTGSILAVSYGGGKFRYPFVDGLQRQLWSTGEGFFWYNPILLLALAGLVPLWRRDRSMGILVAGLALLRVCTYSKWSFPDGSVAWGPRFLLPWCALLVIPVGQLWEAAYEARPPIRAGIRTLFAAFAALSAVVVVASIWVPYEQYWTEIGDLRGVPAARAKAVVAERSVNAMNQLHESPLFVNIRDLDHAHPFPLLWFRGGPTPLGILAIGISIASASLVISQARSADGRARRAKASQRATLRQGEAPLRVRD